MAILAQIRLGIFVRCALHHDPPHRATVELELGQQGARSTGAGRSRRGVREIGGVGDVHYGISGLRPRLRVEGDNVGSYRISSEHAKKIVSAGTCATRVLCWP